MRNILILFLTLTGIRNTEIRVNFDHVKYYYAYDQESYFKSRIEFIDKTVIDVRESVDEIDVVMQDEVSKQKK